MITIFKGICYRIESEGNGAHFLITRNSDGASVYIPHGDDATAFSDSLDEYDDWDNAAAEYDLIMELPE